MWNSEKEFGNRVMKKLTQVNMIPIRIESASTVVGMPDLYVMGVYDYFIEFKNLKTKSVNDDKWHIPWRAGQRAWAQQYNMAHIEKHSNDMVHTKFSWTFVGLKDGVLLIRMTRKINHALRCVVHNTDIDVHKFTLKEFRALDLRWFLRVYSKVATPIYQRNETWYDYLRRYLEYRLYECEVLTYHQNSIYIDRKEFERRVAHIIPSDKLYTVISPDDWRDSDGNALIEYIISNMVHECILKRFS